MPQIGILASKMSIGDAAITAVFGYVVVFFGLLLLMLVLLAVDKIVLGMLADRFGGYVPAYALFALCLTAAALLLQGIYRKLGAGKRPESAVRS